MIRQERGKGYVRRRLSVGKQSHWINKVPLAFLLDLVWRLGCPAS